MDLYLRFHRLNVILNYTKPTEVYNTVVIAKDGSAMGAEVLIVELCEVMRYLYVKGMISALSGNASIRLGEDRVAITPSGKIKFLLRPEDISIVTLAGEHVAGPRPSIELMAHLSIYRSCSECGAVVHVHATLAPLLAGLIDPVIDAEMKAFGVKLCYVEELPPGSSELAEAVGRSISWGCKVVVLKNHGIIGTGKNLGEAIEVVEAVENSFKKALILNTLVK